MNFNQAQFIKSVAKVNQCPEDKGVEVAFVGRANSGKSSLINAITNNSKIAKIGKTPGKTKLLNFFALDDLENSKQRLVDLPGYGYAKYSKTEHQQIASLISSYLLHRKSLKALVILMDSRHPFEPSDLTMLDYCKAHNINIILIFNKLDKLKQSESAKLNNLIKLKTEQLEIQPIIIDYFQLSAYKNKGIAPLIQTLYQIYSE